MFKKFQNAPCVRRNDNLFVAFCLYMTEEMGKPRFNIIQTVAILLVLGGGLIWSMAHFESLVPLWGFLAVALLFAVPAIVGAFIRDRRTR